MSSTMNEILKALASPAVPQSGLPVEEPARRRKRSSENVAEPRKRVRWGEEPAPPKQVQQAEAKAAASAPSPVRWIVVGQQISHDVDGDPRMKVKTTEFVNPETGKRVIRTSSQIPGNPEEGRALLEKSTYQSVSRGAQLVRRESSPTETTFLLISVEDPSIWYRVVDYPLGRPKLPFSTMPVSTPPLMGAQPSSGGPVRMIPAPNGGGGGPVRMVPAPNGGGGGPVRMIPAPNGGGGGPVRMVPAPQSPLSGAGCYRPEVDLSGAGGGRGSAQPSSGGAAAQQGVSAKPFHILPLTKQGKGFIGKVAYAYGDEPECKVFNRSEVSQHKPSGRFIPRCYRVVRPGLAEFMGLPETTLLHPHSVYLYMKRYAEENKLVVKDELDHAWLDLVKCEAFDPEFRALFPEDEVELDLEDEVGFTKDYVTDRHTWPLMYIFGDSLVAL